MDAPKKYNKSIEIKKIEDLIILLNNNPDLNETTLKINLGSKESDFFIESNIEKTIENIKSISLLNPQVQILIRDDRIDGDFVKTSEEESNIKGEFKDLTTIKDKLLEIEELKQSSNIFLLTPGHSYFNYASCLVYSSRIVSLKDIYETEDFIKKLANEINNHELTILEKIFAAYTTIIKMKQYKEVDKYENECDSRNLYTIFQKDNIVCEGFVNLFNSVLDEMGIKSAVGCFKLRAGNHAISIVEVNDPEMGINGNYIFDPTLDSRIYHMNKYNKKGQFLISLAPMDGFALTEEEFLKKYNVRLKEVRINESGASKNHLKFKKSNPLHSTYLTSFAALLSQSQSSYVYNLNDQISNDKLSIEELSQLYESYYELISVNGEYLGQERLFNELVNRRMK